jgi:hypothetical protein
MAAMTEAEGEEFRRVAKLQYQEIEKLRALIAWKDKELGRKDQELDGLVAWIAGDADAHSVLQAIYADPRQNTANKTRAAGLALPFEKAKPVATHAVVYSLFDELEGRRLRALEQREAAAETIQHQPTTVLGEGQGHHQAWHPLDSDKGDPAA